MRMKGSTYFTLFFLVVAIAIIYLSFRITAVTPVHAQMARLLPLIIGTGLAIVSAAQLVSELRGKEEKADAEHQERRGRRRQVLGAQVGTQLQVGMVAAALVGMLLVVLIGFYLGSFVWIAGYLRWRHYGWIKCIALGLGTAIFIYMVFDFVFKAPLYPGVLPIPLYRFLPRW